MDALALYGKLQKMTPAGREKLAKRLVRSVLEHGETPEHMDCFMMGLQMVVDTMDVPEEGAVMIVIQMLTIWLDELHVSAGGCVLKADGKGEAELGH